MNRAIKYGYFNLNSTSIDEYLCVACHHSTINKPSSHILNNEHDYYQHKSTMNGILHQSKSLSKHLLLVYLIINVNIMPSMKHQLIKMTVSNLHFN